MIHIANIDWVKIKTEYVSTDITTRKLAEKHNVSYETLKTRCKNEKWVEARKQLNSEITAKTTKKLIEKKAKENVNDIATVDNLAKSLLKQVAKALEQTETHELVEVKRTKATGVNSNGTPVEQIKEEKSLKCVQGKLRVDDIRKLTEAVEKLANIQDRYLRDDRALDRLDDILTKIEVQANDTD